jgi:colicin import membrane protein
MVGLSGGFHLLMGALFLVLSSMAPAYHLAPVAVVDLVGGGALRQEPRAKAGPPPAAQVKERAAPKEKEPKARRAPKHERAARKAPPPAVRADAFSKSKRRAPDSSSVAERLRQMREAQARSDAVRRAVEEHRQEEAARAAVASVGERVAHRIEAPPASTGAAGAGGAIGGGARGTVRLSPELREYFRRLEEKVRNSWVLPESVARDTRDLVVELRIVIEKDGRVSGVRIESGSGNVYFDQSVERAIRKASPLPIPPEQLRGGEDHYEVGFRFHGMGGA